MAALMITGALAALATLSDRGQIQSQLGRDRYLTARSHYDLCLEQEKSFACRDPANELRDSSAGLLEPSKSNP